MKAIAAMRLPVSVDLGGFIALLRRLQVPHRVTEIAGEQVKAFGHMNLGNITVFDGGNGGTSNFLNTLVKTVAPSLGVLDKLPIGETVKGIINPESKTEEKPATKADGEKR